MHTFTPTAAPYHGLHGRILESSHFIGEVAYVWQVTTGILYRESPLYFHDIYKQNPLHILENP